MQILLEASQVPGDKIIAEDKYNSSFANVDTEDTSYMNIKLHRN